MAASEGIPGPLALVARLPAPRLAASSCNEGCAGALDATDRAEAAGGPPVRAGIGYHFVIA